MIKNQNILRASKAIENGELVIFPTDTLYGIGADPFNKSAVEKIYLAKGRPEKKPLIILISDREYVSKFASNISANAIKIMQKFWPGPLTIIFKAKKSVPKWITAGGNTVGLRIPHNKIAREFIEKSGGYVAAPSANTSNFDPPASIEELEQKIKESAEVILDDGKCELGVGSTIVDLTQDKPKILRQGKITLKKIRAVAFSL